METRIVVMRVILQQKSGEIYAPVHKFKAEAMRNMPVVVRRAEF